ncbi:hypothetical protein [Massilia glaciei]|uniref:Uncharacterized protein n=1 Tax=Massilia glaciei TaxID=1524097 RepID=A0A2U2HMJ5_9BURK|nr:hypothetical protein [Massilia glaciei]PWF48699.1 hypothetical protein C7C56_010340 [Massilia glaciei]
MSIIHNCKRTALLLCLGAGTQAVPATAAPHMRASAPSPPFLRTLQSCLHQAIQNQRLAGMMVVVGRFTSEATGGQYIRGYPQPYFETHAAAVLAELGLMPIKLEQNESAADFKVKHRPNLVVSGTLVGFDPLTSRETASSDGGVGFGGGRGLASLGGGASHSRAKGQVTATVNIESPVQRLAPSNGPAAAPEPLYAITATATASAEFQMDQNNSQGSGSVAFGIGGGFAKERISVADVQSTSLSAVRLTILLAVASALKLSTPSCSN